MLSIVADINIPKVSEAFKSIGEIRIMDAESITPEVCSDADVLLVRSVTKVNAQLLNRTNITFVGSATAGSDHIDETYLRHRGIVFAHASGSNAESVVEYVLTALIRLSTLKMKALQGLTLGIIGCGNIGGQLAKRAAAFGMRILKNDPPLASSGVQGLVDLKTLLTESDIVSLHVPKLPSTYHLISEPEFHAIKPGGWIINTARGDVVDNQALKKALIAGRIDGCVLDVWENEPTPDIELLRLVTIGTPHIAGHSLDGKLWGTIMLYEAVIKHFMVQPRWNYQALLRQNLPKVISLPFQENWLDQFTKNLYDIEADHARMSQIQSLPGPKVAERFRRLRRTYPPRRAFPLHTIAEVPPSYLRIVRDGLRVNYLYPKDRKK